MALALVTAACGATGGGAARWSLPAEGFEVVAVEPDAAIVTDAAGRERMKQTGLPWKVRHLASGIELLLCSPGEFLMGSPEAEEDSRDNERQHQRTIGKSFYIGRTEVTQEQWRKVMGTDPSWFKSSRNPVETVSWNDCQLFLRSSGGQLRLPSEAEWEYACRAGTTGAFAGDLDALAWFGDNSGGATHEVGQKRENSWGLHDMHGNVWEWCEDVYSADYPLQGDQSASTSGGPSRVIRGGSWCRSSYRCRSAFRGSSDPGNAISDVGFRVVLAPVLVE